MDFTYTALPHRVVFGRGAVARLPAALRAAGGTVSPVVFGSARWEHLVHDLLEALSCGPERAFSHVQQHVPRSLVDAACAFADEWRPTHLICIGGGSVIGLGKAVAVVTGAALVVVPTTYSGSEMTSTYGIAEGGRKVTARHDRAVPSLTVYDADLSDALPLDVSGPSAMNALAHAVEARYAPGANPVTDVLADRAVTMISGALPRLATDPNDREARPELLLAACLAGMSLAAAGMSFHHRICHVLGGLADLPHAPTHAALLPHSVALLRTLDPPAHASLGKLMGRSDPEGACFELLEAVLHPHDLGSYGLSESVIDAATGPATARAAELYPVAEEQVRALLEEAAQGRRP